MEYMIEDEERIRNRKIAGIVHYKNGEASFEPLETIIHCQDCLYFKAYKDAPQYGSCISRHTFDGAFRDIDYCSYAKERAK